MRHTRRKSAWAGALTLVAALAYALAGGGLEAVLGGVPSSSPERAGDGAAEIERLFASRVSGRVIEGRGRVRSVLSDDQHGSRHQRFVLEFDGGHTVLVSHNIGLAPRLPGLAAGDRVEFRGQYEWNEKGGVLHWTHHDPDGRRPGGWLRRRGETYR